MTNSPDIEWLQRKWGLPDGAADTVLALLKEESRGSTACLIPEKVLDWGKAAGAVNGTAPLVVIDHMGKRYLQSRRLCRAEREIAARMLDMAGKETPLPFTAGDLLFPAATKTDLQAEAARVAMSRQLAMITGGPGTGKTYTLARILALLVASGIPANMIRLAAPTGKASDRMKKAVSDSLSGLPAEFQQHLDSLVRIAESSSTLHKLLGYNPQKGCARFDASQPLPCSVLIVDECSMVDVMLWRAVLQALPADSRLVLLGDPNQLESVGQGNVFAEMTRCAGVAGSKLGPTHVHLTEARRFKERPDILAFARALEQSDADAAVRILENVEGASAPRGIGWLKSPGAILPCADFPKPILDALENVAHANTPQDALDALGKICILTAQRDFFVGSQAMSAAIEQHFFQQKGACNQPVIINHNDSETGLRNGTVGVIHTDSDGKRKAWFHAGDGKLKEVAVAKLPDFSPAWAITIHRSQGSEYDDVLVVLPREESPMTTRELLYTAITRAKHNVYVAGELGSVRKAATTSSDRCTMLASFLQPEK
ncbi:MAG: exodeoxyribonuclease V subunit alpha [Verrucomicrobiota bacterium]